MSRLLLPVMIGCMVSVAIACAAEPPVPVPSSAAPTSVPANRPPAPVVAAAPVIAMLNDGSKVEFDADDTVWVLGPDGSKAQAPDGTLTLKDGTPFVVKEGKRVPGDD